MNNTSDMLLDYAAEKSRRFLDPEEAYAHNPTTPILNLYQ